MTKRLTDREIDNIVRILRTHAGIGDTFRNALILVCKDYKDRRAALLDVLSSDAEARYKATR